MKKIFMRLLQNWQDIFRCGESVIARKALDCKKITKDIYNKIVQTAIDNYNQMKENREKSGGNYYNTMGSRLDGNFVKALCESISMGRTSYTEAYRLTNTSRKTFSEVAAAFWRYGMVEEKFLIDSNSFMTPYRQYYGI